MDSPALAMNIQDLKDTIAKKRSAEDTEAKARPHVLDVLPLS